MLNDRAWPWSAEAQQAANGLGYVKHHAVDDVVNEAHNAADFCRNMLSDMPSVGYERAVALTGGCSMAERRRHAESIEARGPAFEAMNAGAITSVSDLYKQAKLDPRDGAAAAAPAVAAESSAVPEWARRKPDQAAAAPAAAADSFEQSYGSGSAAAAAPAAAATPFKLQPRDLNSMGKRSHEPEPASKATKKPFTFDEWKKPNAPPKKVSGASKSKKSSKSKSKSKSKKSNNKSLLDLWDQ